MACANALISGHLTNLCNEANVSGIKKAWFFNHEDLKLGSNLASDTVVDVDGSGDVQSLFLNDSKKIYRLEGRSEASFQATTSYVQGTYNKGISHSFIFATPNITTKINKQLIALINDATVAVIFQTYNKGEFNNKSEFLFAGFNHGLKLADLPFDSNAEAVNVITLTSRDGAPEPTPFRQFYVRAAGTDSTLDTEDDVYTTLSVLTALEAS